MLYFPSLRPKVCDNTAAWRHNEFHEMIKASVFYSIPKRHLSVCFQNRNMFHLMNGINYAGFNCLEKSFQVHLSLSVCEDVVSSLAVPQNKLQLVMAWINIMIPYPNYSLGNTEGYKYTYSWNDNCHRHCRLIVRFIM